MKILSMKSDHNLAQHLYDKSNGQNNNLVLPVHMPPKIKRYCNIVTITMNSEAKFSAPILPLTCADLQ